MVRKVCRRRKGGGTVGAVISQSFVVDQKLDTSKNRLFSADGGAKGLITVFGARRLAFSA